MNKRDKRTGLERQRHGHRCGSVLITMLLVAALWLTACGGPVGQTPVPDNSGDDPFQVSQEEENTSSEKAAKTSESSEAAESSDSPSESYEDGQAPTSETDGSSHTLDEVESEGSQGEGADSSQGDSSLSEEELEQEKEKAHSHEEEEGDFGNDSPYNEAYCKEQYKNAAAVLDEIGWDLRAAYDWCVYDLEYYEDVPIDWELGTEWYAELGLETGQGHCYTYAAIMTEFARLLGYEARQVAGNLVGRQPFHHSWVEIVIDGETYVLDPEVQWEMGYDCYLLEYYAAGTLAYDVPGETVMVDGASSESLDRLELAGWPRTGPYTLFLQDPVAYHDQQTNDESGSEEGSDPNEGCLGDDVPFN